MLMFNCTSNSIFIKNLKHNEFTTNVPPTVNIMSISMSLLENEKMNEDKEKMKN